MRHGKDEKGFTRCVSHVPALVDPLYRDLCPSLMGYKTGLNFGLVHLDCSIPPVSVAMSYIVLPARQGLAF